MLDLVAFQPRGRWPDPSRSDSCDHCPGSPTRDFGAFSPVQKRVIACVLDLVEERQDLEVFAMRGCHDPRHADGHADREMQEVVLFARQRRGRVRREAGKPGPSDWDTQEAFSPRNWLRRLKRLGRRCRHGPVRWVSRTHATNTWALPRASLERLARVVTGWSHGRCSPDRQDGCGSVNHVPREMNRTKEELSPQTHVCEHCVHRQIVHREHRDRKLNRRPL